MPPVDESHQHRMSSTPTSITTPQPSRSISRPGQRIPFPKGSAHEHLLLNALGWCRPFAGPAGGSLEDWERVVEYLQDLDPSTKQFSHITAVDCRLAWIRLLQEKERLGPRSFASGETTEASKERRKIIRWLVELKESAAMAIRAQEP
ncbi:hypothetical protein BGZ97_010851, partial [Linnemannia gamsii]